MKKTFKVLSFSCLRCTVHYGYLQLSYCVIAHILLAPTCDLVPIHQPLLILPSLLLFPFSGNHHSTFNFYEISFLREILGGTCLLWLADFTMFSGFIHIVVNNGVSFYDWMVFHCVCVAHFNYLFIIWWTLRLFPVLDYCEQCTELNMAGAGISLTYWFHFFRIYT